jgi:hypothetical protein
LKPRMFINSGDEADVDFVYAVSGLYAGLAQCLSKAAEC